MDCRRRLPEEGEDYRIRRVSTGELHVGGKLVRRYALQHQLAQIGVFTLIAFQWHIAQAKADESKEHNDEQDNSVIDIKRNFPFDFENGRLSTQITNSDVIETIS